MTDFIDYKNYLECNGLREIYSINSREHSIKIGKIEWTESQINERGFLFTTNALFVDFDNLLTDLKKATFTL